MVLSQLRPALVLFLLLSALTGLAYPLGMTLSQICSCRKRRREASSTPKAG
ncbi:hypothetical protein [Asaia prunellae]|uniref:hypothetical protein n=1 Tax=Asaia prunellae TaxID=610245 RepID=UPI000B128EED